VSVDPIEIIGEYYLPGSLAHYFLSIHGLQVAQKALTIAGNLKDQNPDLEFIEEAAQLHDIGIIMTNVPEIGCFGTDPYIKHGVLGKKILLERGLQKHALVCERHLLVGLSAKTIKKLELPLPVRDMKPVTLEEKIICYADKFFSKRPGSLEKEKTMAEIEDELSRFSEGAVKKFLEWAKIFEPG